MKKTYMKPTIQVVEIQKRRLMCGSPYDKMGGRTFQKYSGGDDTITDIDDII